MNGWLMVLELLVVGGSLLLVRYLHRTYSKRPVLFWVLATLPMLAGLAATGWLLYIMLAAAEGLAAFLLHVSLVAAVLWLLGYFLRVFPHRPLVYLALLPALLSLALVSLALMSSAQLATPRAWLPILAADALVVLLAAADAFTLPRKGYFAAERQAGRVASLRQDHPLTLTISNLSGRPFFIWVRDDVPEELNPDPNEFRLNLAGRSRATLRYHVRGRRRGAFVLSRVFVRARSKFGLWQRLLEYEASTTIHVYPDMKQLSEYALLARTNRLSLLGVRRTRRIGQDNEFERLRDYSLDDNYKHIDWRATARRRKLTVKDFQTNQSQRLIFLIDCGRMMTNQAAGLSLLDHSLNAMLMLSYVALSHGDSVGLLCFSDEVHGYVPPTSGMHQMNRLLHSAFDRFPRLVESRYDQAFLYLASHCRKRSLVVLMSNIIDEVNANQVGQYLKSYVGKHLPMGVLLRDRPLFEAAEVDAQTADDSTLYRAAAAAEIVTWRHQVLADLESRGVLCLDVYPEDLTAPLVNSYLEIKARHLL